MLYQKLERLGNIESSLSILQYLILMPRIYPRRRRMVAPIQSYKKVINIAPTSRTAATNHNTGFTKGVDSVAAGQTSVTDQDIPTGAVLKYVEIQHSFVNLISVASFMHTSIQLLRSGQSAIAPNVVGGDPQRNQVFHQAMMTLGKDQNGNRVYRFKIPKKYQRVRDGDQWVFSRTCDTIFTDALQVIYKFYR